MTYRRLKLASIATVAAQAAIALLALARAAPGQRLATHWNAAGVADRFAAAPAALFVPVATTAGAALLLAVVPAIEPLQQRLDRSAALYRTAWAGLLGLMLLVEAAVAAPLFGVATPPTLVLGATGVLLIAVGNVLPKSRPGFFVGIRTPWTLSDPDNWVATHRLGAWTMIAGGVILVAAAVVPLPAAMRAGATGVALAVAVVPPLVYSFVHWRRKHPA